MPPPPLLPRFFFLFQWSRLETEILSERKSERERDRKREREIVIGFDFFLFIPLKKIESKSEKGEEMVERPLKINIIIIKRGEGKGRKDCLLPLSNFKQ